ncbi:hypothetical protein Tco_0314235, partial [Tanacetum coccineum]
SDELPSQDPYVMAVARWRSKVASHPSLASEVLTARKSVRPLSSHRLALRYTSHHSSSRSTSDSSSRLSSSSSSSGSSSDTSSDSLTDSSSVHSSGCDTSGQTYSGPSTRVVSSRLVYPPVMTPRYSEAFSHWRFAPLSTPYLPTTSGSSPD